MCAFADAPAGRRRAAAQVKWFNVQKGFGFVTPDDGSEEIFVHQTAIHAEGFRSLKEVRCSAAAAARACSRLLAAACGLSRERQRLHSVRPGLLGALLASPHGQRSMATGSRATLRVGAPRTHDGRRDAARRRHGRRRRRCVARRAIAAASAVLGTFLSPNRGSL
jgi:hypothetical protein